MSCIKKIKTCEIFGDTIFPRIFLFNQEPQVVMALIQKNDEAQKRTIELTAEADIFKLDVQSLNLEVGKYSITYVMDIEVSGEVIRHTFCIENLSIENRNNCGCSCEEERSFEFVVELKEIKIDVDIVISPLVIGEGGNPPDLSDYAKKDASNIAVVSWQNALDVYRASDASTKNASQDLAISSNTTAIQNEVIARQNADANLSQTITELNGIVTTIKTWKEQMTTADVDTVVNTISEVLAVFQNAPEGANIVDMFNQKLNIASVVDNLTSILTDVPLSANQGRFLKSLIDSLTTVVGNKVDKVAGKGLSENDFTSILKAKLEGLSNYNDTALVNAINNKVDKDGTKVLSDFNFSIVEKNKVDGLFLPTVKKIETPLVVSTVAGVVVPELTTAVEANKNYKIEFYGSYTSGVTTTGGSIACTVSGAAGVFIGSMRGAISSSAVATELSRNLGSTLTTTGVSAINTPHYLQMEGVFVCSTSGNLVVKWGSEVETSPVTLSMGFFIVTEL